MYEEVPLLAVPRAHVHADRRLALEVLLSEGVELLQELRLEPDGGGEVTLVGYMAVTWRLHGGYTTCGLSRMAEVK